MAFFIFDLALFLAGLAALTFARIPVTRRRAVQGSAARVIGAILMAPLPLYMMACKQTNVDLLGAEGQHLDPIERVAEGYIRLFGFGAALVSLFVAGVLAILTSEAPRRP